ncbi:MAG TPA: L-rhamnose mutarotase [Luteitalea sp.]|nr:L-rhamnose mutarotase [Luteitalea sp.]
MTAATETVAFRMQLHPGQADEYRRRHDALWPELATLLREAGVVDYRIFLDEQSLALFAVLTRRVEHGLDALPSHPVMWRWWAMMADIMDTHPDNEPVQVPLTEMFRFSPS